MFDCQMFDCVRLQKVRLLIVRKRSIFERLARKNCEFDCVRLPNPIENNRSIEFDWVRLPNVRLTTPGLILGRCHQLFLSRPIPRVQ